MLKAKPAFLMFISSTMYIAFGMFNSAIGPILGELADRTGSSLAAIGSVLTFLFLGSLIAQLIAGPLFDRVGQRSILAGSLILLIGGLIGFTSAKSLPLMLGLVFITGLGQGGIDLGANLVVSSAYPKNNAPMLNLLHFFFGLGAFLGPAAVSLALVTTCSGLLVQWVAAGVFVVLLIILLFERESKVDHQSSPDPETPPQKAGNIYLSPVLWLICAMILAYVGVEYGTGSWSTRYMEVTAGMPNQDGALVTSAFWGALTLSRLAGTALSRRMSAAKLLTLSMSLSVVAALGILASRQSAVMSIVFIILIGISFGTIYPTTVALIMTRFPGQHGKAIGLLAAFGSIGGLLLPWLLGIILDKGSAFAYGLGLSVLAGIMLILMLSVMRSHRNESAEGSHLG